MAVGQSGGKGHHMTVQEYIQRVRRQGLLDHILRLMREVKQHGGERSIYCKDPDEKQPDVEIIIRRTSEISSRGLTGIEAPK